MRAWGGDPDVGPTLIVDGLASRFRIVAADYEARPDGQPGARPADPGRARRGCARHRRRGHSWLFAWYGYSWLALTGLQVALRTDRRWALAMGGYPPVDGPYAAMLDVTRGLRTPCRLRPRRALRSRRTSRSR